MDILKAIQTVFKDDLNSIKYNSPIKNTEIIPDVKMLSIQFGFPAIGLIDGGESTDYAASTQLKSETIVVCVYVNVIGDQEKCIEEVRGILSNCIDVSRKKELYRDGGAFEGFQRARCSKKSEIKTLSNTSDGQDVIIKLARIDFIRQEVL